MGRFAWLRKNTSLWNPRMQCQVTRRPSAALCDKGLTSGYDEGPRSKNLLDVAFVRAQTKFDGRYKALEDSR